MTPATLRHQPALDDLMFAQSDLPGGALKNEIADIIARGWENAADTVSDDEPAEVASRTVESILCYSSESTDAARDWFTANGFSF